jgi:2-keto-4-pentenoate hydratase
MSENQNVIQSFWDAAWNDGPTPLQWAGQLSFEDGVEIQLRVGDLYEAHGIRRYGWKVAATNKAVQAQLGVSEPAFGTIVEKNVRWSGAILPVGKLVKPHVECELAFRLNSHIENAKTLEDIRASVSFVHPSFEYIEKRVSVLALGVALADNAEHTGIVLGRPIIANAEFDYSKVTCTQFKNGEKVESGTGEAVLGNPLNSILWLKNALESHGRTLKAGDLVLTGSFVRQLPISSGDEVRAEFTGIGSVEVRAAE